MFGRTLGRPRGRRVDCNPNRRASDSTHRGSPSGRPTHFAIFVKHGGACIAAIQGVVLAASLIGTFRSGHCSILANTPLPINES